MFSKILKASICGITTIAAGIAITSCANVTLTDYNRTFDDSNFTKINVDIDWGEIKIIPSNDNKVYIDAKDVPDSFKSEINNGVLIVSFHSKKFLNFLKPKTNKTIITIKVPAKDYEKLDLDLGSGDTTIKDLNISKIDIDCGDCKLNIKNIKTDNILKIDGGTGSIDISESIIGGLNADFGEGKFNFNGTINGDIDIDCGIGDVNIELTNSSDDFNGSDSKYSLKVDKGIGKFNIYYNK